MDIFKVAREGQYDYHRLKKQALQSKMKGQDAKFVIIIPVRGMEQYHKIVADHFRGAIGFIENKYSWIKDKIVIVFSEHSSCPTHQHFCTQKVEEYIWTPALDRPFNKCVAHNIAALSYPRAEWYLFHDTDILVSENFFDLLWDNIKENQFDALQCFTGRRLVLCSQIVTKEIFDGKNSIGTIKPGTGGTQFAQPGASGGSILVKNELFYNVGGFDPEFFTEYSIEDQFFFDKLNIIGKFGFADNPPIECFHLWHPPAFNRLTKPSCWDAYESFKDCTREEQTRFIAMKAELLKNFLT